MVTALAKVDLQLRYNRLRLGIYPCFWCGGLTSDSLDGSNYHPWSFTKDHVIPRSKVGKGHFYKHTFTVPCCYQCNKKKKGARIPSMLEICRAKEFRRKFYEHLRRLQQTENRLKVGL